MNNALPQIRKQLTLLFIYESIVKILSEMQLSFLYPTCSLSFPPFLPNYILMYVKHVLI